MSNVMYWNGQPVAFAAGETVATALLRSGLRDFGQAPTGQSLGVFCGVGQCQGCLVTEKTLGVSEACLLQCTDGMELCSTRPGSLGEGSDE
jgi:hypothetical protein